MDVTEKGFDGQMGRSTFLNKKLSREEEQLIISIIVWIVVDASFVGSRDELEDKVFHMLLEMAQDYYAMEQIRLQLRKNKLTVESVKSILEDCKQCVLERKQGCEQQISVAPLLPDDKHTDFGCPICKHIVSSVQNYCANCGVKLNWLEIERRNFEDKE